MTAWDDLRKSAEYVKRYEETLIKALNASRLIACEGRNDEISTLLDCDCGIDYILVSEKSQVSRGLACRLQEDKFGEKYHTFTIRKSRDNGSETEFEKRKKAIEKGGLYPSLTLQGYIDTENDCIDRLAVVRTEELIDYCDKCDPPKSHTRYGNIGQAEFFIVNWDEYKKSGRWIVIRDPLNKRGYKNE